MSCGLSLFMRLPPTTTTTTSSTLQLKVLHIFEMLFANECRQNVGSVIGAGIGRFAVLQQHKTKENLTASLSTHTHTYTCTRTHRKRGTYILGPAQQSHQQFQVHFCFCLLFAYEKVEQATSKTNSLMFASQTSVVYFIKIKQNYLTATIQ